MRERCSVRNQTTSLCKSWVLLSTSLHGISHKGKLLIVTDIYEKRGVTRHSNIQLTGFRTVEQLRKVFSIAVERHTKNSLV